MSGRVAISREGRQELETELQRLEAERVAVAEQLRFTREQGGDPSEEHDLHDAIDTLSELERRCEELRGLLAAAEPLETGPTADGAAQLGTTVTVRLDESDEATFVLVSPAESAPRRGRLSVESPIGRALIGARAGDEVVAETPSGPERLRVLHVS